MERNRLLKLSQAFIIYSVLIFLVYSKATAQKPTLNDAEFRDRVYACWLGKNIGGTLGMPFEGKKEINNVTFYTNIKEGEPAANDDLDIVFIGNSITQGVQLENAVEEAPPAYATRHLRTLKGVESAQFLNRGRSGYTTVNFLPSADGELSKVILAVRDFHTDQSRLLVFSISLGTNDSAEEGPKGSPVSPSEYRQNMKAITGQLLTDFPGCKVVIQQPIWYSPTTYNRSRYLAAGLARLQSYFPELKSLVKDFTGTNPGRVYMGDTKAFDYFRDNYLTELIPESGNAGTFYLHPNKKGAESLGKFWAEGIWQSLFLSGN